MMSKRPQHRPFSIAASFARKSWRRTKQLARLIDGEELVSRRWTTSIVISGETALARLPRVTQFFWSNQSGCSKKSQPCSMNICSTVTRIEASQPTLQICNNANTGEPYFMGDASVGIISVQRKRGRYSALERFKTRRNNPNQTLVPKVNLKSN